MSLKLKTSVFIQRYLQCTQMAYWYLKNAQKPFLASSPFALNSSPSQQHSNAFTDVVSIYFSKDACIAIYLILGLSENSFEVKGPV
jgi:hypothetical protein